MSNTTKRGIVSRVTAALGAAALSLAGAAAIAAPAEAAPLGDRPAAPYSLTVHKYAQPEGAGTEHDGSELTAVDGTPIDGVTYRVNRLDVDLETNEGWLTVDRLNGVERTRDLNDATSITVPGEANPVAVQPATDTTGAPVADQVTAGGGVATFPNLPLGVYMVSEVSGPAGVVLGNPFFVTLPLPQQATGQWLKDVHVYPKNAETQIEKAQTITGNTIGAKAAFPIRATVPNLGGERLTDFVIVDQLDEALTLDTALPETERVTVSFDRTGLTRGTDYQVESAEADGRVTVTVTFTEAGRAKLEANQGGVVTVTINGEVRAYKETISNTATLYVNDPQRQRGRESNTVESSWAQLSISKVDAESSAALAGATFRIYDSAEAAQQRPDDFIWEGTTDAAGQISATLFFTDGNRTQNQYWLVEHRAPDGYVANPEVSNANPRVVEISATANGTHEYAETVTNSKVPDYQLPLTGGTGTALFVGAGLALIAAAIGAAIVNRRKQREAEQATA